MCTRGFRPMALGTARNPRYLLVPVAFVLGAGLGYLIAYITGTHASLIPLASALIGLVVAFSVPLWQVFFVNTPRLSVEITSITRTISEDAVISIDDDPELNALRLSSREAEFYYYETRFREARTSGSYTLAEIDERLIGRKQRL